MRRGMLISAALAFPLAIASSIPAAADEIIYSFPAPSTHVITAYALPRFSENISQGTDGNHSLRVHSGSVLVSDSAALEAVGDGVIDAAYIFFGYTPGLVPALSLIGDLPGTSTPVSAAAATETMLFECEECLDEMDTIGVYALVNGATEPYELVCAGRHVTTLDDARGLKVRATGPFGQIVADLGMTPVNITFGEMYEAMQRGQIDCSAILASGADSVQLWDVSDYVISDLALGTSHGQALMTINRELWDSFSAAERRVWLDNAAGLLVDSLSQQLELAASVYTGSAADQGVVLVAAAPDLQERLAAVLETRYAGAIETARGRGVGDPEGIAAAFAASYDKWAAIADEIGPVSEWAEDEWETFRARVQSEIFDRIPSE